MLEIMDRFVHICEENNLTYFLTGGTLLGAVRHKGFIPWDDDVDIAMPRKDFEKFLDIVPVNKEADYYALSHRCPVNTFYHYIPFAKFCKKGSTFAESHIRESENHSGIWIDIWPIDNCVLPLASLQDKIISFAWKVYRYKTYEDIPKNKIKYIISKFLCFIFTLKSSKAFLKYSYSIFNNFNTKYICAFSGIYGIKKERKKTDTIFPLTKLSFENKDYSAPGNWDAFLTRHYGDYMKLPPVEQRRTHEPKFIIFGDE